VDAPRLMRVVLDSNILFSALISPHGAPHRLFQAWRVKRFELVTCSIQVEHDRAEQKVPSA
jgi:predicted nucleic acid-binding protein